MAEPDRQVTSSPVSAFITFGEGAPAAPAALPGTPARPVDTITPLARQFQALSETAFSYMAAMRQDENKQTEDEFATAAGNLSMSEIEEIEELKAARKQNQISVAALMDSGKLKASDNPWAKVGAMRGLAELNARETRMQLDRELKVDFDKGEITDPDQLGKYILDRSNPLGLSGDVLGDYYYSSNYEKSLGVVRERATLKLNDLIVEKAEEDAILSTQARITDALDETTLMPVDPALADILEDTRPSSLDRINAILADGGNRAHLGNNRHNEVVTDYLITLAKSGRVDALQALNEATLSNGSRLADTDYAKATISGAMGQITTKLKQQSKTEITLANEKAEESVRNEAATLMAESGLRTPLDLVRAGILRESPDNPDTFIFLGLDPETGGPKEIQIPLKELQFRATQLAYANEIDALRNDPQFLDRYKDLPPSAIDQILAVNGASAAFNVSRGTVPSIVTAISEGLEQIALGGEANPEVATQTLSLFRAMRMGDTRLVPAYFTEDQRFEMTMLDAMVTGSTSAAGAIPARDITKATEQLRGLKLEPARLADAQRVDQKTRDAIEKYAPNEEIRFKLLQMVQVAQALGIPEDADTIADNLADQYVKEDEHYQIWDSDGISPDNELDMNFAMEWTYSGDPLPPGDNSPILKQFREASELYPGEEFIIVKDPTANAYYLKHALSSAVLSERFTLQQLGDEAIATQLHLESLKPDVGVDIRTKVSEVPGKFAQSVTDAEKQLGDVLGGELGFLNTRIYGVQFDHLGPYALVPDPDLPPDQWMFSAKGLEDATQDFVGDSAKYIFEEGIDPAVQGLGALVGSAVDSAKNARQWAVDQSNAAGDWASNLGDDLREGIDDTAFIRWIRGWGKRKNQQVNDWKKSRKDKAAEERRKLREAIEAAQGGDS
tara:strand:- start:2756 stop:5461 length:2706 start_codon:yes stop_codon:yes gene_type:complete